MAQPTYFSRSDEEFRAKRKHLPIEEKESYRWIEGYLHSCDLKAQLPEVEVVSISDREGDIYELYELRQQRASQGAPTAEWIVRANQDRVLPVDEALEQDHHSQNLHLFEQAQGAEFLGYIEFELKARQQFKKIKGNRVKTQRGPALCASVFGCARSVRARPIAKAKNWRR